MKTSRKLRGRASLDTWLLWLAEDPAARLAPFHRAVDDRVAALANARCLPSQRRGPKTGKLGAMVRHDSDLPGWIWSEGEWISVPSALVRTPLSGQFRIEIAKPALRDFYQRALRALVEGPPQPSAIVDRFMKGPPPMPDQSSQLRGRLELVLEDSHRTNEAKARALVFAAFGAELDIDDAYLRQIVTQRARPSRPAGYSPR